MSNDTPQWERSNGDVPAIGLTAERITVPGQHVNVSLYSKPGVGTWGEANVHDAVRVSVHVGTEHVSIYVTNSAGITFDLGMYGITLDKLAVAVQAAERDAAAQS